MKNLHFFFFSKQDNQQLQIPTANCQRKIPVSLGLNPTIRFVLSVLWVVLQEEVDFEAVKETFVWGPNRGWVNEGNVSKGNDQSSMSYEAAAATGPLLPDWKRNPSIDLAQ